MVDFDCRDLEILLFKLMKNKLQNKCVVNHF